MKGFRHSTVINAHHRRSRSNADVLKHKNWVIDQMDRALTGCPIVEETINGRTYSDQGESEEYLDVVKDSCGDEYSLDVGVAP